MNKVFLFPTMRVTHLSPSILDHNIPPPIIEQDRHFTSRNCKIWKGINISFPHLNTLELEEYTRATTHC